MQKHSETALDTPKKEGTESSFPVKVHLIPGKTPAIYKIFVVQAWCNNQKKNRKSLKNQRFAIQGVPGAGIEPARIAPLVFETSASTDSAIRAGVCFSSPGGELGLTGTMRTGVKRLPDQG